MHALNGAYLRVSRARTHLNDLTRRAKRFSDSHANHLTYDFNPHTQKAGGQWRRGRNPSQSMSILVGEVIYNLRAALDYLVYELARLDSGRQRNGTQFPIESKKGGFDSRRDSYLNGVCDKHAAAIELLQPYKRCQWTRLLASISNPDKHRKLTDSRGIADIVVTMRYGKAIDFSGLPGKVYPAQGRFRGKVFDVYVHATSTVDVTFNNDFPILPALEIIHYEVTETLEAFKPCFEGQCAHRAPS